MADVLRVLLDTLRAVGTCLLAVMPASMGKLLDQLGVPPGERRLRDLETSLPGAVSLPSPAVLFPRVVPVA